MKKIYIFLLIVITATQAVRAQFSDHMKHHVIIAFDEARSKDFHGNDYIRDVVLNRMLSDSIIRDGDFLSVIGFSLNTQANDLSHFTYVLNDVELGKMKYMRYSDELKSCLRNNWRRIASKENGVHHGSLFSLISLAKMYALDPVKKENKNQYVNRTFLVMISDHVYNGIDIYSEIVNYYKYFNRGTSYAAIQDHAQIAVKEFFAKILDYWQKDGNSEQQEHVDLFEYIPLQENVTLPAILDYEAPQLKAKRVKGGKYILDIASVSRNNPHFNVLKLEYTLYDENNKVLLDTFCMAQESSNVDYCPIDSFSVSYLSSRHREAKRLHINAWVGLCDGIYNATILSPVESAPSYLGPKGLSVDVSIGYEAKAKILGLVPLPSWMMFCDNQERCNTVISLIFVVLLALLVVWGVRKLKQYNPTIDELTIRKIY